MSAMIRILFSLVGYLSVATVITAVAGYGYLRHSGALDDDRMFQIVSILHGIDLDEIGRETNASQADVPPEEMSYGDQREQIQVETLHLQAKRDGLEKMHTDFDATLQRLIINNKRIQDFQADVETYLEQRKQEALDSGLVAVGGQWQNLTAKKQTKEILKMFIADGRTDVVILLLNGLPKKKRTDILKTLDTEDDLQMLYKIQKQMLAGHPEKTFIDEKIDELNQARQQDNILR